MNRNQTRIGSPLPPSPDSEIWAQSDSWSVCFPPEGLVALLHHVRIAGGTDKRTTISPCRHWSRSNA